MGDQKAGSGVPAFFLYMCKNCASPHSPLPAPYDVRIIYLTHTPAGYAFGISLKYNINLYIIIFNGSKAILAKNQQHVKHCNIKRLYESDKHP